MFPLNLLEELIKPITLALRLFGNIFAGGIMLALIGLMPFYIAVGAEPALEGCSTCSSAVIQAFIFALLTVLYFAMAGAGTRRRRRGPRRGRRRGRSTKSRDAVGPEECGGEQDREKQSEPATA